MADTITVGKSSYATWPKHARTNRSGARTWTLVFTALCAGCAATSPQPQVHYFPAPPSQARIVQLRTLQRLEELAAPRPGRICFGRGTRSAAVARPMGLAYAAGHLLICDPGLSCIHDWNLETGAARRVHAAGNCKFANPVAVDVGPDGRWYVADPDRGEIVAFTPGESNVSRFHPGAGTNFRPVALAVRADQLFVADVASHQIHVYETRTGELRHRIGGAGDDAGALYFPSGVVVSGDGNLLVADTLNSRVQVFGAQYQFVRAFGRPGNRLGDMGKPRHMGISGDDVVFIADAEFHCVHIFSALGQLLMVLNIAGQRDYTDWIPFGIAVVRERPAIVSSLVPADFHAHYFLFVSSRAGITVYAVGLGVDRLGDTNRPAAPGR